jgi:protein-S-isoprenylcysteine O-methyltransferase Ste14
MTIDALFRIIVLVLFATSLSVSVYFRRRANRAGGDRISRREEGAPLLVLLRLTGMAGWLSVVAYVINPDWMRWSALSIPVELRWLGVALSVLSVPLLIWMFRSLGTNVTDTVAIRSKHTLVTHGPYRWVRHPLYSLGTMLFVGIGLIASNWFILLAMGLGFVLLAIRTPIEEARLTEKFGDEYRAYLRRTGRFIPRLM